MNKFEQIKSKLSDPETKAVIKQVAISIGTAVVVALVVNATVYVVTEGSKKLVNEVKDLYFSTEETPTE